MSEKGKTSPETGYSFSVRYPAQGESASALDRIADEIGRLADATYMLARATAGEFDEPDETIDPDAARLPDGYRGMR